MIGPVLRDLRGQQPPEFPEKGTLFVVVDPDAPADWDWDLKYAKPGDVGLDLPVLAHGVKFVKGYDGKSEDGKWFDIPPGSTAEIATGLRVKIPDDSWGNIRSRSSTGFKHGLIVLEAVIDPGYIGPLYALVFNPTSCAVRIVQGMRLAQLVLIPKYELSYISKVDSLPATLRGKSGFGSSGL